MRPSQAAKAIGITVEQVRWLIRNGRLAAKQVQSDSNQHGYVYDIAAREVERFKKTTNGDRVGRPRGATNRTKKRRRPK